VEKEEIPLIMNRAAGQRSWMAFALEKLLLRPASIPRTACWPAEKIERAVLSSLRKEGLIGRPHFTEAPGDATRIAKRLAGERVRRLVVAGGDGTINEVANGLIGTETALGILPIGTANSYALELGLPFSLVKASRVIREGRVRTVDVGKAGERFFVMGAGMSFDARVIQAIKPRFKRLFGAVAFILTGAAESLSYSFPRLEVESEVVSAEHEGYLVIIANARYYGGCFRVAPGASLEDGLLDVIVMKRKGLGNVLRYLFAARRGKLTGLADVDYFQCRRVSAECASPVPVHVDAEIASQTPCGFECVPRALRVICPGDPF
jgi:YegS/Rv2252/BmrU family lipid kinase